MHENFRDDPTVMKMLRAAIGGIAMALPAFEGPVLQRLLESYREAVGERGSSARFSAAAMQLENDATALRRTLAQVLGSCLYSQLDRLQGREASWPQPEGDGPELVPDAVINRRLAIDRLTRRIDLDADEGFSTFDLLLGKALGRQPSGIRNNPLRPAVFFHALGLCWTRAGGLDELTLIEFYGEQLLPRIAAAYPAMCAVLRDGLGVAKPPSMNALMLSRGTGGGESPYSRLAPMASAANDASRPSPAGSVAPAAAAATAPSVSQPASGAAIGVPSDGVAIREFGNGRMARGAGRGGGTAPLESAARVFEPLLTDEALPLDVRLAIARLQVPALLLARDHAGCLDDPGHPFRVLLAELSDPQAWRAADASGKGDAMRLQLGVIVGMLNHHAPLARTSHDEVLEHLIGQFRLLRGDSKVIDLSQHKSSTRGQPA